MLERLHWSTLRTQFAEFDSKMALFLDISTIGDEMTMDLFVWWSIYGVGLGKLINLATSILTQVNNSSTCTKAPIALSI